MIPSEIKKEHVLAAIAVIDRDKVPNHRKSRSYDLVHDGNPYPPKYLIALAAECALGRTLDSKEYGGGSETNNFLRRLGFTVAAKSNPPRRNRKAPRHAPPVSGTSVKVGRVFLNLGVRMSDFRTNRDFVGFAQKQFNANPATYRNRIISLFEQARDAGAEVVVLPACALIVGKKVSVESYAVPSVPLVIAGGLVSTGEFAVVMEHGVETERFDAKRVHWLDAGRFTVLTAISSTIGTLIRDKRYQEPVESYHSPPDPEKPILVVDVGHQQYGSRYLSQTLRCAARDASRPGKPATLVLSSWTWSTKGIRGAWCQPADRVSCRRVTAPHDRDILDIVEVDLSGRG